MSERASPEGGEAESEPGDEPAPAEAVAFTASWDDDDEEIEAIRDAKE